MTAHPNCKIVEDRLVPGEWRIETMNENGRYEAVLIFRGVNARLNAIAYARRQFDTFDEIPMEHQP
jgi:hypothetical protein